VTQNKGELLIFQDVEKYDTLLNLEETIVFRFIFNDVDTEKNIRQENVDWFIAILCGVK
jgi:hypothetical protein